MNLLDRLVTEAMDNQSTLAPLRIVVEKELLHHDIMREMSGTGLLAKLTFIGGTCLRACYGANRLSEYLDFTGGRDFDRSTFAALAEILESRLQDKYGLSVKVKEPIRETGNVDTWKIRIITHPKQRNIPQQLINIDICAIPSHDPRPMLLRNHYGVDMGTSGLIIQAQSREEIFADKLIAFALRPNRLKNRDLWDMGWLKQIGITLPLELLPKKLKDHRCDKENFLEVMNKRLEALQTDQKLYEDFKQEMRRFLPGNIITETVENPDFWSYLIEVITEECRRAKKFLTGGDASTRFTM